MPHTDRHEYLPDPTREDPRGLLVPATEIGGVPPGIYAFAELRCQHPDCYCRCMYWRVTRLDRPEGPIEATIGVHWPRGWVPEEDAWMYLEEEEGVGEPFLFDGGRQGPHAEAFLAWARDVLLQDPEYLERIRPA